MPLAGTCCSIVYSLIREVSNPFQHFNPEDVHASTNESIWGVNINSRDFGHPPHNFEVSDGMDSLMCI